MTAKARPDENIVSNQLAAARSSLRAVLHCYESLMVAYSGGVDSAYLAWEAHQVLGSRMLAVIADSPSLPRTELAAAVAFTEAHAIPLRILETREMERADYVRNDAQRCFYCKDELFMAMERLRAELGFATIAYGRNMDDDSDFRPSRKAAHLHRAAAPLVAAGLGKQSIRVLARAANLSVWDKPASACLSSRLEYGRPVTREALLRIEQTEAALHELGYRHFRVRHHGDLARIELDRATLEQGLTLNMLNEISLAAKAAGFTYVTVDAEGYRRGSMNQVLPIEVLLQAGTSHAS